MPAIARLHKFHSASQQNRIAKPKLKLNKLNQFNQFQTQSRQPIRIQHIRLQPVSSKNIMHAMERTEFIDAVNCLVKDVDKKYDEVLIDRFADLIKLELESKHNSWLQTCKPLVETLQSLIQNKAFVMFDQARAFKLLRAIVCSKAMNRKEYEGLQPLLDSFWLIVPNVVVNNNLPAATVMLHILRALLDTRFSDNWMLHRRIDPPLKINQENVSEIATLARFYLKSSNNYHTKNRAEELFRELLSASYFMNLPSGHPLVESLLGTVRELLMDGSDAIVIVIMKLLSDLDAKSFCNKYGVSEIVQECFEIMVKKPRCNFIILCKCLALSSRRKFLQQNIDLLKSNYRVEALIVFSISRPNYWEHNDLNEFVETYLIYPILSSCSNSSSKELISKLKLNALDTQQIDKCNHPRLVLHCFIHLNQLLEDDKLIRSQLKPSTLAILMKMIAHFVRTHVDSKKYYKSIFECSTTLRLLFQLQYGDHHRLLTETEQNVFDGILEIIEIAEENFTENRKPILINFLKLIQFLDKNTSPGIFVKARHHLREKLYEKTVNMAYNYNDVEILEEFLNIFTNPHTSIFSNCVIWFTNSFLRLLWDHMLPKFRAPGSCGSTLGRLLKQLLDLDLLLDLSDCEDVDLEDIDILKTVGDVLIERATDYNVIEPIIQYLRESRYLYNRSPGDDGNVSNSDSSTCLSEQTLLAFANEKSFNRLTLGFCTSIWKSELPDEDCLNGVKVILRMTKIIVETSSSKRRALGRLVKAGVLATVQGIALSASYPMVICIQSNEIATYIKKYVKLENLEECIFDELKVFHQDDFNSDKLRNRARKLAEYYTRASYIRPMRESKKETDPNDTSISDNITLMVQNFLNYPQYDNTMDCH